jgi:hypothetical protein
MRNYCVIILSQLIINLRLMFDLILYVFCVCVCVCVCVCGGNRNVGTYVGRH